MLCAQSLERLASATFTYAAHIGGADTGAVTAEHLRADDDGVCDRGHGRECEHVHDSRDAERRRPSRTNGIIEIDASGATALGPQQRRGLR